LIMEAGYRCAVGSRGQLSARRLLEEVASIVPTVDDAYLTACAMMIEGHLDIQAGRFASACQRLSAVWPLYRAIPGTYFEQTFCHCFRLIGLRHRGQLGELQAGFADWVLEAERRGDRFSEASLRFNLNNVWLARDDPDEALRDLARVTWVKPDGGYHVQHWYEQNSRAEVELYAGRSRSALPQLRAVLAQLSHSFIVRLLLHRSLGRWLLGRLILASVEQGDDTPGALEEVSRLADALASESDFGRAWAQLLYAGVASCRRQVEKMRVFLAEAMRSAKRSDLPHCEHSACYRLGASLGGSEGAALIATALAWFEEQRIANPARMIEIWAPGFQTPKSGASSQTAKAPAHEP